VRQPVEWLLFSSFSVVLTFVHLFTMFMLVPIFKLDDADRPLAARGRRGRRRERLARRFWNVIVSALRAPAS